MPSTRTPIRRDTRRRITPEAVELFKRGETLRPTYEACVREGDCRSDVRGRHCTECREFLDTCTRLDWEVLKFPPWHISVFDAELDWSFEVPNYMRRLCAGATWAEAWDLRRELIELAGE